MLYRDILLNLAPPGWQAAIGPGDLRPRARLAVRPAGRHERAPLKPNTRPMEDRRKVAEVRAETAHAFGPGER